MNRVQETIPVPEEFGYLTSMILRPPRTNTDPLVADTDGDGFDDGIEVDSGSDPGNAAIYPAGQLVSVTFNETRSAATIELKGLAVGQIYHLTGSVDGLNFFKFSDSDFTAETSSMEINQDIDVSFRSGLLLKVELGPALGKP